MPTIQLIPNRCNLLIVELHIKQVCHYFIVDTGCTSSCVNPELVPALTPEQLQRTRKTYHKDAGGATRTEHDIPCPFRFAGVCLSYITVSNAGHNLSGVTGLPLSGLIGQDLLRMFSSVVVDYKKNTITFFP